MTLTSEQLEKVKKIIAFLDGLKPKVDYEPRKNPEHRDIKICLHAADHLRMVIPKDGE